MCSFRFSSWIVKKCAYRFAYGSDSLPGISNRLQLIKYSTVINNYRISNSTTKNNSLHLRLRLRLSHSFSLSRENNLIFVPSTRKMSSAASSFTIEERGSRNSLDYRVFFRK